MVDSLTALDLATARARHASWLGASRPSFLSAEEAAAVGLVSIPHAWHPLLLQPCLPALPAPPAVELRPTAGPPGPNQNGSGAVEGDQDLSAAGVGLVPELVQDAAASEPAPKGPRAGGQQPAGAQQDGSGPARPVPTDLRVPPGVGVVAVTGPNTGGKTASLKALGLLSLMAKAGCFIPQAPAAAGEAEAATAGPRLVWFDQVRLAVLQHYVLLRCAGQVLHTQWLGFVLAWVGLGGQPRFCCLLSIHVGTHFPHPCVSLSCWARCWHGSCLLISTQLAAHFTPPRVPLCWNRCWRTWVMGRACSRASQPSAAMCDASATSWRPSRLARWSCWTRWGGAAYPLASGRGAGRHRALGLGLPLPGKIFPGSLTSAADPGPAVLCTCTQLRHAAYKALLSS